MMIKMKYEDVKALVRDYFETRENEVTSWVQYHLGHRLGLDFSTTKHEGITSAETRKFMGQVSRALNALAEEGFLAKEIVHTHGHRKEAKWITRASADAKAAAIETTARIRREREAEQAEVITALSHAGVRAHYRQNDLVIDPESIGAVLSAFDVLRLVESYRSSL